jgi:hypothetical protein
MARVTSAPRRPSRLARDETASTHMLCRNPVLNRRSRLPGCASNTSRNAPAVLDVGSNSAADS